MSATATAPSVAGAPFAVMLKGALVPSAIAGLITVVVYAVIGGGAAALSALLGVVVAIGFFASGMVLLSRMVRSANPFAFAVGLKLSDGFRKPLIAAVDGPALGISALVVTLVWQVFAMRAFRAARFPVYDEPTAPVAAETR